MDGLEPAVRVYLLRERRERGQCREGDTRWHIPTCESLSGVARCCNAFGTVR
jgi:hypothetical protein